jgi:hypothetical protein
VDNPFLAPQGATAMQLGHGTFDPLIGADYAAGAGPLRLSIGASARPVLYHNDRGFRAGSSALGGVAAAWPFRGGTLAPGLGLEGFWADNDHYDIGEVDLGDRGIRDAQDIEDTGLVAVFVSPRLRWQPWERLGFDLFARLPAYQRTNSLQLVPSYEAFAAVRLAVPDLL